MQHRCLLAAIALFASSIRAEAQLGLTAHEIQRIPAFADTARWSATASNFDADAARFELTHEDKYHSLRFVFLERGGPAVRVEFSKSGGPPSGIFLAEVVENILEYNGGKNSWARIPHDPKLSSVPASADSLYRKMWRRRDGAIAYYQDPTVFILTSASAATHR